MFKQLFQREITYSLHRWQIFKNKKYLNCYERIERCHSMNFEDYNLDRDILKKNEKPETNKKKYPYLIDDSLQDEDIGVLALTYYHF